MRRFLKPLFAFLAGALGLLAVGVLLTAERWYALPLGLGLHVAASRLAVYAAEWRRGGPLESAERDTILLTALLLPALGPALAWWMPRGRAKEQVENAHEVVEKYLEHVKPRVPAYERSLYTGDFERDLARKLDMESYREVLRHGETDQKRSALFRLAELGRPHHLALIRGCLEDEDQEVRLYAYGELDRLVRRYEGAVRKARLRVKEDPGHAGAHLELGVAHLELATSGVLDPRTAAFHLRVATDSARKGRELAPEDPVHTILLARVHVQIGDLEAALARLAELPADQQNDTEVILVRAEVAFVGRDFDVAREMAGRLIMAGKALPEWLAAICVAEEPEEEEPGADAEPVAAAGAAEDSPEPATPPEREREPTAYPPTEEGGGEAPRVRSETEREEDPSDTVSAREERP